MLDLGSGGGIDVILSAKRVGETGLVYGLDMTPEMAAAARAGFKWINTDGTSYLESMNVHATLFMAGMWAEVYPAVDYGVVTIGVNRWDCARLP